MIKWEEDRSGNAFFSQFPLQTQVSRGFLGIVLLFSFSGILSSQSPTQLPAFSRVGLEDGLSHSRIYALLQDDLGFIWIGTSNGLNRFDGRSFRYFKNLENDPTSLPNNYVTSLLQDRDGLIWVGTNGGGIGVLNPYTGIFDVYNTRPNELGIALPDDKVWGLLEDRNGQIWAGTSEGGVVKISQDRRSAEIFRETGAGRRDGLSNKNVWPIIEDPNGDIWIGTDGGGLNRYIPNQNRFIHYMNDPNNPLTLSSDEIFSLYIDRSGTLWVGTAGGGLNRFERSTGSFYRYKNKEDDIRSLSNNTVRAMIEDDAGNFWVGTTEGLNLMDRYRGDFTRIFHVSNDLRSLSNSRIHTMIEDSRGMVWIGTRDGLNRYVQPVFTSLKIGGTDREIPPRNDIRSMLPADDGSFIVGTFDGIYHLLHNGEVRQILNRGIGYQILHLDDGIVAATDQGLILIQNWQNPTPRIRILAEGIINSLFLDTDGILWFGSETQGLGRYNPMVDRIRWFDPESPTHTRLAGWSVVELAAFDSQHLIIGLRNEPVQLIHRGLLEFSRLLDGDRGIQASAFLKQSDGKWWFAPEQGGLILWDPEGDGFTRFTEAQGLPSDLVKSLILDEQGSLWFGTIRGIGRFTPGDGYVSPFGIPDGLPGLIYNPKAITRDGEGKLYFGSTEGIASIDPFTVKGRMIPSNLAIEVFDDLNREKNIFRPGQEIILEPQNRILLIRLTAFHYSQPNSIRYSYSPESDDRWLEIGNNGEILFSNLAPGNHRLLVRATNPGGGWMENPREILISVRYPIYLQWYMISLYGILLISGIYMVIYFRGLQHKRIIREQDGMVRKRTEELLIAKEELEGVIQKKSRFFINLAHETKTPLTFIQNYLDRYIETHPKEGDLVIVKDNVDKLVRDMVNYLDTEKIRRDSDYYDHDQVVDLNRLLTPKMPILSESARLYELQLQVNCQENLLIAGDPLGVERVVNNLIDNAIKYNRRGGEVCIEARENTDGIFFQVRDTGPGIGSDQLESLGDPFFQLSHPKQHLQGIGMGLYIVRMIVESMGTTLNIQSNPGVGSSFTVIFPKGSRKPDEPNPEKKPSRSYHFRLPPPPKPRDTLPDPSLMGLLLVDDDTDMLTFLNQGLGGKFNLRFACSGEEVLSMLDTTEVPDLIISDIMMEGMNGHELLEALQKTPWRSVPLIFLSAKGDQEEYFKSFNQGAMDFIPKPFKIKDLIGRIEARLSGQERRRSMLMESVQLRIAESLKPLRTARDLDRDVVTKRSYLHHQLDTSPREEEILDRLVQGKLNKEIAGELGISVRTVEKHISNLYKKAGVQNKVELVNLVLGSGSG